MNVRRVALVVHDGKPLAVERADELRGWLASKSIEVVEVEPDLVVSLGGDGTVLRAAQEAHRWDAPLLGVNLGALGYLTEVEAGHEILALERILAGDGEVEERAMLACTLDIDGASVEYVGLNEALVERSSRHRLVRLRVTVDGAELASFNADGVIVATPTGSTAYALSAGGPLVAPDAACLVIVPVSPHMILARPFVFGQDSVVEISVDDPSRAAALTLDGAVGCELPPGAVVRVARHPRSLKMIHLDGPGFLARLKIKLDLPG